MLDISETTSRLLLAAALGAVIGFDRERHSTWAAGLRTHMLVCLGAALAMIVSAFAFSDILKQPHVILDPSRIAAQVISGIGFLGAGTIMFLHRENVIRGLTTAAGLWTVAAIGLAVGGGMYAAAVAATAIAWVILAVLKPLERRLAMRKLLPQVRVGFAHRASLTAIEEVLIRHDLPTITITARHVPDDGDEIAMEFTHSFEPAVLGKLVDALRAIPGVESVAVDVTPPAG